MSPFSAGDFFVSTWMLWKANLSLRKKTIEWMPYSLRGNSRTNPLLKGKTQTESPALWGKHIEKAEEDSSTLSSEHSLSWLAANHLAPWVSPWIIPLDHLISWYCCILILRALHLLCGLLLCPIAQKNWRKPPWFPTWTRAHHRASGLSALLCCLFGTHTRRTERWQALFICKYYWF